MKVYSYLGWDSELPSEDSFLDFWWMRFELEFWLNCYWFRTRSASWSWLPFILPYGLKSASFALECFDSMPMFICMFMFWKPDL